MTDKKRTARQSIQPETYSRAVYLTGNLDDSFADIWSFGGRTQQKPCGRTEEDNIDFQDSESRLQVGSETVADMCGPSRHARLGKSSNSSERIFKPPSKTINLHQSGTRRRKSPNVKLRQLTSKTLALKARTPCNGESPRVNVTEKLVVPNTPKRKNCDDSPESAEGEEDDEDTTTISQLESSIVMEKSPIQIKKRRRKTLRQLVTTITLNTSIYSDSHPTNLNETNVSIHVDQSEGFGFENLASQISEDFSSQQSYGDSYDAGCRRFLGTPHDEGAMDDSSQRKKKSLLESYKSIKARHDSAVRLFSHDLRKGKYDGAVSLQLVVRKVIDRGDKNDKIMKTLMHDSENNMDRWIILKAFDPRDIYEGVCLTLYMPWQEISVRGEVIIIGAEFYKIARNINNWGLDVHKLEEILNIPLPKPLTVNVPESLYMDLVPYHVKNNDTVMKQTSRFLTIINISVVILYIWKQGQTNDVCLVKDSDEFLSFLKIPRRENRRFVSELIPYKFFKLSNVSVRKKVHISESLAPFSVLNSFGVSQAFFYELKWERNSKWHLVDQLDISINDYSENPLNLEEIEMASVYKDERVALKCKITEKGNRHFLVRDLASDRSLMIELVLNNASQFQAVPLELYQMVDVKFLRLIRGKVIWDQYTSYNQLSEDVEVFPASHIFDCR